MGLFTKQIEEPIFAISEKEKQVIISALDYAIKGLTNEINQRRDHIKDDNELKELVSFVDTRDAAHILLQKIGGKINANANQTSDDNS